MNESSGEEMTVTALEGAVQLDAAGQPTASELKKDAGREVLHDGGREAWIAAGLFLLVFGVYALSGPGRIDIIDGEARYNVALNWLIRGQPIVTDHWIGPEVSVPGRNGFSYSFYGPAGSFFSIPLVWLGIVTGAPSIQPSQFLFSLTSAICGAGIASFLFLFYLELGVSLRRAVAWTLVSSFATYIWAISTSTFDNAQHAFFTIAAVYFAFVSARRKSWFYALCGGISAGILFLYQEYFVLIAPLLALATLDGNVLTSGGEWSPAKPGQSILSRATAALEGAVQGLGMHVREAISGSKEARRSCLRYGLFLAGVAVGVLLMFAYNQARFGSWFDDGRLRLAAERGYPSIFGSPLAGFLTLLVSPGKSIFLYSPPILLAILGTAPLWRRRPGLLIAIGSSTLILVLFLSCIAFAGGDWCWGPRYLSPLLPLWALTFPFIPQFNGRRGVLIAIIAAGVLVQALALSVENQRFFFERGLHTFFWKEDPWFYFQHSAFFARFSELASLAKGVPQSVAPPANVPRALAPVWMQNYKIFYLPRPWPLWFAALDPAKRPVALESWVLGLLGTVVLGAGFVFRAIHTGEKE